MSTLVLTCDVFGATPSARVSWWVDGHMIDDGYEEIAPGKSRNTMRLETLTRNYSDAEFTCIGTNTNDNNHAITISTDIKLNCKCSCLIKIQAFLKSLPGPVRSWNFKSFERFPRVSKKKCQKT